MSFNGKPVKGVLLDITGVLQEDGKAIPGSVEAVEKLKNAGIDVRFVTNETQLTRKKLLEKLHGMKFSMPEEAMYVIFSPLKQRGYLTSSYLLKRGIQQLRGQNFAIF